MDAELSLSAEMHNAASESVQRLNLSHAVDRTEIHKDICTVKNLNSWEHSHTTELTRAVFFFCLSFYLFFLGGQNKSLEGIF